MSGKAMAEHPTDTLLNETSDLDLGVPPLCDGERLTRAEFERRYHAMPHVKKAELLEGVVVMPSPVRINSHGEPHGLLVTWLGVYRAATPGVRTADNATVRLDSGNELQPDAILFRAAGGGATISDDDYVEGIPELVVEVAASSADHDAVLKRRVYERNGVPEYLLWRTQEAALDWWELRDGAYVALPERAPGVVASRVFPGLWLDRAALLEGDMARVLATVQQGIASAEHRAFVEGLASE